MNSVSFKNVSFSYKSKTLFNDVSFNILSNEFIAVVGPNGSGKTTLLKLILGLLIPESGQIKVLGHEPGKNPHKIAYVPQHIQLDWQFPVSVSDIVKMGCLGHQLSGFYSAKDHQLAQQALKKMDIFHLKDRSLGQLSGGERQRVLIARALTCDPLLLLLDEPTANVDNHTSQKLMDQLAQLNQSMTIIMVSHEYYTVSHQIEKVICVNQDVKIHDTNTFDPQSPKTEFWFKNMKFISHETLRENSD